MESRVSWPLRVVLRCSLLLVWLAPSTAIAQSAPPTRPSVASDGPAETSRLWLVAGAAFATLRGDCQTCEEDFPYRHAASVLADVGYRVNDRMDVGGEALSVVIGTGWAFRPARRVGFQVFGAQHVAALGDLQTPDEDVEDVVGNFWSLGIAIVIR
jgi:hypothetical protein